MTAAAITVESTDGVEVAVTDHGPDRGDDRPVVVLCHATGFCGGVWYPMVEALAATYRCITFDFRAHGRTALPDGVELVWTGFGDDLTAVVDWLRADGGVGPGAPIRVVGHSMGATAVVFAEHRRPGTFERAWLFEPILFPAGPVDTGDAAPEIAKAARRRRAVFDSRAEVLERYGSRLPLSLLDDRVLAAYATHGFVDRPDGSVELACAPDQEASVFEHHNTGAEALLGELRLPVVLGASGDGGEPADSVVSAAADRPHLTLVSYPDLTHFGPLQEPDRLAVDVARFFAGESVGDG